MHIALVISQAPPIISGVARIAARLEHGLRCRGDTVDLFSAAQLPRLFFGEYRFVNVLPLFQELQRRSPFDVICIHGPVPTFSDLLLLLCASKRQQLGNPRIIYTHHWDVDISKVTAPVSWVYNLLTRMIARLSDMVITSSVDYDRSFARFVPEERRRIVPWGTDSCFQCPDIPQKAEEFTILYVGQLRPYKGADILLRASAHLQDCKLIIVGDGYYRSKYVELATSLNLRNVTFVGEATDEELMNLYARSHVIVMPSVSKLEAFGIVLLEGMGAGCVPVASNLPGVVNTVGNAGLIFEVGNATSLAEVLYLLKTDKSLFNRLSRLAWSRSKSYNWDITCQCYLDCFENLDNLQQNP